MSNKLEDFNWSGLEPGDGYFVELVQSGDALVELFFGFKHEGRVVISEKLDSIKMPSHADIGDLKRRCIFYNGLAEYLNAGGSDAEYLCKKALDGSIGRLLFHGWKYFDHGVNTEGNHVHEFISEEQPFRFVRWVRNEFVDTDLNEQEMLDECYTGAAATSSDVSHAGHIA